MAIDTLYTSATYNAFTTALEMDDIMTALGVIFNASFWTALDAPSKEALIKASTRYINTLDWLGDQNTDIVVSSMKWPRTNLDGAEDTIVPYEIQLRAGCWIIHNATANGNGSGNKKAGSMKSKNVGEGNRWRRSRKKALIMMKINKAKSTDGKGLINHFSGLKKADSSLTVGVQQDAHDYADGTSVLMVAMVGEFGNASRNIAPRHFLSRAVKVDERFYKSRIIFILKKYDKDPKVINLMMNELGRHLARQIDYKTERGRA